MCTGKTRVGTQLMLLLDGCICFKGGFLKISKYKHCIGKISFIGVLHFVIVVQKCDVVDLTCFLNTDYAKWQSLTSQWSS